MSDKKEAVKKSPPAFVKYYLLIYNLIETLGWSYLLFKLVTYYVIPGQNQYSLYETVKWPLFVFQNAAVLEIFNAFARFVPSNPFVTLQQVFSRVFLVCGVLIPTILAKDSIGLPLALLAWSITEIIRYGFYFLNLINAVPHILIWLRYTTFIVLYPIGVTGELLCLYAARTEFSQTGAWSIELPNSYNFSFSYGYLLIIIMLAYIPFFPQLYLHMFVQRKKALGTSSKKGQ